MAAVSNLLNNALVTIHLHFLPGEEVHGVFRRLNWKQAFTFFDSGFFLEVVLTPAPSRLSIVYFDSLFLDFWRSGRLIYFFEKFFLIFSFPAHVENRGLMWGQLGKVVKMKCKRVKKEDLWDCLVHQTYKSLNVTMSNKYYKIIAAFFPGTILHRSVTSRPWGAVKSYKTKISKQSSTCRRSSVAKNGWKNKPRCGERSYLRPPI